MDRKDNPAAAGRSKASGQSVLRGVVACYLIYLGGSLLYDQVRGISTLSPVLVWIFGPLFVVSGALFALFTWRRWKTDSTADAEKPETASDAEASEPSPRREPD